MKIETFEKICNEFGGYYECHYSEDGKFLFVDYNTNKCCLFPDDLESIRRKLKEFTLQYICIREDKLWLYCIANS